MNLDYEGAEQNFTILSGETVEHVFLFRSRDGSEFDVSDATFDGVVTAADGTTAEISIGQNEADVSSLSVFFPELETGNYHYEIRSVAEDGTKSRVVYGRLGVLDTSLDLSAGRGEGTESRKILVHLPGGAKRSLMLEWKATSAAKLAAAQALKCLEEARNIVATMLEEYFKDQTEYVEKLVQRAEAAASASQELFDAVEDGVESLKGVEAALVLFDEKIRSAVVPNTETNTWWIGGVNTGVQVTGDPGKSPKLSSSGTWLVWDPEMNDWEDTGVQAAGEDGRSPYVNALGHWVTWNEETDEWEDTGIQAMGKDGLDGDQVRRILVDRESDIPQEGETCNGGYYYYVPHASTVKTGEGTQDSNTRYITLSATHHFGAGELRQVTIPCKQDDGDNLPTEAVYLSVWEGEGSSWTRKGVSDNSLHQVQGAASVWEFSDCPLEGTGFVRLVPLKSSQLNDTTPPTNTALGVRLVGEDSDGCVIYRNVEVDNGDGTSSSSLQECAFLASVSAKIIRTDEQRTYDVYGWLEDGEGQGSWVLIGEANDIATAEIYGLVKYGTDVRSWNGAPVAPNADGQMTVPLPDYTVPGAAWPSEKKILTGGGPVGVTGEGRLLATKSVYGNYGAVQPSTNEVLDTSCIGMNGDDQITVQWASYYQEGVVRLGSKFGQTNPIPYQQGVGATSDHELCNNLLYGGALQHMTPANWSSRQMPWLDEVLNNYSQYFGDMFYTGICTSDQFSQSTNTGLELLPATTTLLAGVYLAESREDMRDNAVLNAAQVAENYVNRDKFGEFVDEVETDYSTTEESRSWTRANFYTKDELDASWATKEYVDENVAKCMKINEIIQDVWVLEQSELPEPVDQKAGRLYITITKD